MTFFNLPLNCELYCTPPIIASTNNNFSDSLIKIGSVPRSWIPTIDISSNYFGYYTTQEMYTIGARKNVTNIYDYFDDITLPELLYHPSPLYPLVDIGCNLE